MKSDLGGVIFDCLCTDRFSGLAVVSAGAAPNAGRRENGPAANSWFEIGGLMNPTGAGTLAIGRSRSVPDGVEGLGPLAWPQDMNVLVPNDDGVAV